MKDRAKFPMEFHTLQAHRRKAQAVGPERRPGGKNTFPHISSQPGRSYSRRPCVTHVLRELPDQPYMGIFFKSAESFRHTVLRFKHDHRFLTVQPSALVRNSELLREVVMDSCDHLQFRSVILRFHHPYPRKCCHSQRKDSNLPWPGSFPDNYLL